MPIRPPRSLDELLDLRKFSNWCQETAVTPTDESVGTNQIAGAGAAADNSFHVKRSGAMAFDTIRDADCPASLTRDSEMVAADAVVTAAFVAADAVVVSGASAALAAHVAAVDPHPVYLTQTEGDARYPLLSNTLNGSATYDPASLTDGSEASTTVTVTGAALGDFALASFSLSTQGIKLTAEVTAADTVTVNFHNKTGGTLDLGSGTLKARVFK